MIGLGSDKNEKCTFRLIFICFNINAICTSGEEMSLCIKPWEEDQVVSANIREIVRLRTIGIKCEHHQLLCDHENSEVISNHFDSTSVNFSSYWHPYGFRIYL